MRNMNRSAIAVNHRVYVPSNLCNTKVRLARLDMIANNGWNEDQVTVVRLPRRLFKGHVGSHITYMLKRGASIWTFL